MQEDCSPRHAMLALQSQPLVPTGSPRRHRAIIKASASWNLRRGLGAAVVRGAQMHLEPLAQLDPADHESVFSQSPFPLRRITPHRRI